jgi:hypothetical protein
MLRVSNLRDCDLLSHNPKASPDRRGFFSSQSVLVVSNKTFSIFAIEKWWSVSDLNRSAVGSEAIAGTMHVPSFKLSTEAPGRQTCGAFAFQFKSHLN